MTPLRSSPPHRWLLLLASLAASAAWAQVTSPATATRWVQGSSVNLRAAPSVTAPVLRRLALNVQVQWRGAADGGFCKVVLEDPAGPVEGYTACQYLAATPLAIDKIVVRQLPDGKPNPAYDPVKLFWISPTWRGMVEYAMHLHNTKLPEAKRHDPKTPYPVDPELQRMKEHLAKGLYGSPAREPLYEWDAIQREARDTNIVSGRWSNALQLSQTPFDASSDDKASGRLRALVAAIQLPSVGPSAFAREADVAPPHEGVAEMLSGRFGIVHSYRLNPPMRRGDGLSEWTHGTWDVKTYGVSLTKPVNRITLFRDGRTRQEPTHASRTDIEYGDMDLPMCGDFTVGFLFGDGDPAIWRTNFNDITYQESLKIRPAGTLFSLYTAQPLPGKSALLATQRITLDREKTGFVRAVHLHYDLDGDGVADLSVWEGTGRAAGHLDEGTKGDDAYHRAFFINIAGRWRVFAIDSFQYGCGC